MNSNFTQTITVRCDRPEELIEQANEWDRNQAKADIMGYIGSRILANRDEPGVYIIEADFGIVDPEVSAFDEAQRNNDRPETQEWAERLRAITTSEPEFRHYDEIYRTGF